MDNGPESSEPISELGTVGGTLAVEGHDTRHEESPPNASHGTPTPNLNNALRFSGSSVRPAYPGFMVMKKPHVGTSEITSPRKSKTPTCLLESPRTGSRGRIRKASDKIRARTGREWGGCDGGGEANLSAAAGH